MTPAELTAWRQQAGLSQAGLARLLDVDKQTVWRWEHGERAIPSYLRLALQSLTK
jgi:transcriptional regulator with XRE-family HTH domain